MEEFLNKIKNLTPIQSSKKTYNNFKNYKKNKDYYLLNETKSLYKKRNHFSKIQLKEFSILYIMLNYFDITFQKISDLSKVKFETSVNESLKNDIIKVLQSEEDKNSIKSKIFKEHEKLIIEIQENSSIQIILTNKNNESVAESLNELLIEFEELKNQKKIESLENDIVNNLDENSLSELIKLKSQINRE